MGVASSRPQKIGNFQGIKQHCTALVIPWICMDGPIACQTETFACLATRILYEGRGKFENGIICNQGAYFFYIY